MKKILVVEDDISILTGLKDNLEAEGFRVLAETDGQKGYDNAVKNKPDLILLDVNLPSKNGFDVCRELRTSDNNVPVIMLTARVEEADKILGLELGADDYVTKPFSIKELIARVNAVLRRHTRVQEDFDEYTYEDVYLNFKKMEARKGKKPVGMSLKEFEIMKYFIQHEGEVVTRSLLLDNVWGYDVFPTTRTVDNYILMLRKKLENDHSHPKHILTMHTAGYKFIK